MYVDDSLVVACIRRLVVQVAGKALDIKHGALIQKGQLS